MAVALVHLTNVVRVGAMFAAGYDVLAIPLLVYARTKGDRRWWLGGSFVAGVELLLAGRIVTTARRWNDPSLTWWGAPLLLAAALLLAFAAWSFNRQARRDR